MLLELKCDKFIEPNIYFHNGVNIILGDNNASNSIGKSTFLMIIDFIFGGKSYLKHNKDVIENIGHHTFMYNFKFDNNIFYFKRNTNEEAIVYQCNKNFNTILKMSLDEYNLFLKKHYSLNNLTLSFREIVGLFSRIWGKGNDIIDRPLHIVANKNNIEVIGFLLALFEKNQLIKELQCDKKIYEEIKKGINNSAKIGIFNKINKLKYKKNIKDLDILNKKLADYEKNIFNKETTLTEEMNKKISELNLEKRKLLNLKISLDNKVKKIIFSKEKDKILTDYEIKKILEFFPSINKEKLVNIDKFYKGIINILDKEIKERINSLKCDIDELEKSIKKYDEEIEIIMSKFGKTSKILVEEIVEIINEKNLKQEENENYDKKVESTNKIKEIEKQLKDLTSKFLDEISIKINNNLKNINEHINPEKKPPILTLSEKNYSFENNNNTGTGKGYENLLIFDIALFTELPIPFLIHDSFLFKNIGKDTMENILKEYNQFKRQIFISLDESNRYDKETQHLIQKNKVLSLDKSRVLFNKNWSNKI